MKGEPPTRKRHCHRNPLDLQRRSEALGTFKVAMSMYILSFHTPCRRMPMPPTREMTAAGTAKKYTVATQHWSARGEAVRTASSQKKPKHRENANQTP